MVGVCIKNGQVILRNSIISGASVLIRDGRIRRVGNISSLRNMKTIDAKGYFVSPGFIDSHIHGDPAKVLAYEIKYGTTAIVPAISCAKPENTTKAIESIKRFKKTDPLGPSVLGMRLEGPYINKARAGAQDKRFIRRPSTGELRSIIKECGGLLKIVTLAPEVEGASGLIRILRKGGIVASMGHTDAGYEEGLTGIASGISHATHLFNGMRKSHNGSPSAALACLGDRRVQVEVIFDMIHVTAPLLRLALSMKEREGIILITDSVRADPGEGKISGGVYRLRDGTIAGSALTMIEAVKNAVLFCGADLKDAVAFASSNPARLLGVDALKGYISMGKDADIVIFDKDFDVKMTMARGKIAYRKRGF